MIFKNLTVDHYEENEAQDRRVTLSAANICAVVADKEDTTVRNKTLRHVVILMTDGGSLDLVVNHNDLELLEEAVGAFPDIGAM